MKHILLLSLFITACATAPQIQTQAPATQAHIALSWETGHAERAPWSDEIISGFDQGFSSFSSAKDIGTFCPKFKSLGHDDQLKVFGEIWVGVALYESSFNPASSSVDVGEAGDKDTYSVGLFQMSVVDQENYHLDFGYKYADLLLPIPNIKLAQAILKKQVEKYGLLAIPAGSKGLYWATLHPGGKYDETAAIAARTIKNVPECK